MKTIVHEESGNKAVEVRSDTALFKTPQEALDLMMELSHVGDGKMILHKENIAPAFFDLKTGLAGEILQKFVNYQMQLAIIGDFKNIASESLKAFIVESNRGRQFFFVEDLSTAKSKLLKS